MNDASLDGPVLEARRALDCAQRADVPSAAIAFYARWWQLETWLRELAYLELRAAHGAGWLTHLANEARAREQKDSINRYMASPDAANTLAYLDSGYLFDLVGARRHWRLFESVLPPRQRWLGNADALKQLRNRNAHCRRPHPDDVARLEQTLRDLEPGLWRALVAYNHDVVPPDNASDPVVVSWLRREHPDATRLIEHARANYSVMFSLTHSRRPWARETASVSGTEGYLWHANFHLLDGALSPRELSSDHYMGQANVQRLLVHFVMADPSSLTVTFAAVDEAHAVADAVGACFDSVISASRGLRSRRTTYDSWKAEAAHLDARFHVGDALALAHESTPFSIFQAGR